MKGKGIEKGHPDVSFDFLGYIFKPRQAQNAKNYGSFTNWLPAVSIKAMKSMNEKMREWEVLQNDTKYDTGDRN